MIRDEDVRLFWIEQLKPLDVHLHSAQTQPGSAAPIGPGINPVMLVCQTRDQQYRRRQNQHQRAGDKPRPPEAQLADDSGPASCARLRRVGYGLSNQLWRRNFRMHLLNSSRSRSEEHTSELQSPCNLVCRLLLEKKK